MALKANAFTPPDGKSCQIPIFHENSLPDEKTINIPKNLEVRRPLGHRHRGDMVRAGL